MNTSSKLNLKFPYFKKAYQPKSRRINLSSSSFKFTFFSQFLPFLNFVYDEKYAFILIFYVGILIIRALLLLLLCFIDVKTLVKKYRLSWTFVVNPKKNKKVKYNKYTELLTNGNKLFKKVHKRIVKFLCL